MGAIYGLGDKTMTLQNVTLLGDVHLDKKFRVGVPLHRLGEREELVWKQFEFSLANCHTDIHCQVGDIFDRMCVSETAVLRAAGLYKYWAKANPSTKFILYRGNHDASRNSNLKSSFDVLAELLAGVPNIRVFKDTVGMVDNYGFLPWHPFKTADQLAFDLVSLCKGKKLDAVFCHCDVDHFGGSSDNLIPTTILSQITDTVVTGHIHIPDEFDRDGVHVIVTGSMQPYSHAEDLKQTLYKTLTLQEYEEEFPEQWKYMNLRILLQPGEILPEAPDCLSFIGKAVGVIDDEPDDSEIEVSFDNFDMDALFHDVMREREVGQQVMEEIWKKYKEVRFK